MIDHRFDSEVHAAFEVHRVHAGSDRLYAFVNDGRGQHSCGGGAVTGNVGGLQRHLAHHLRPHVLEFVLELNLLGDGDAVLGDTGRAESLVQHNVATLRAERDLHRSGEDVDAAQHLCTGLDREFDVLG